MMPTAIARRHRRVELGLFGLVADLGKKILIAHDVVSCARFVVHCERRIAAKTARVNSSFFCNAQQTRHTARRCRCRAWPGLPLIRKSACRGPTREAARVSRSAPAA